MSPIISRSGFNLGFGRRRGGAAVASDPYTGSAFPILNTSDAAGQILSSGTRTDANNASIVLAVPMDGANNGTTFTDQHATIKGSGSAKTFTITGTVNTSTSVSKFYGSSMFVSGTGTNYLLASNSTDYAFGTGDFTIECWYYVLTTRPQGTYNIVCSVFSVAGNYSQGTAWHSYVNYNSSPVKTGMYHNTAGDLQVPYTFPLNQWVHIAYVRSGNTLTIYHDGVGQVASTALSGVSFDNPYSSGLLIGRLNPTNLGGTTGQHHGHIQDFRIYKGLAKYTSNFTP